MPTYDELRALLRELVSDEVAAARYKVHFGDSCPSPYAGVAEDWEGGLICAYCGSGIPREHTPDCPILKGQQLLDTVKEANDGI